MLESITHALQGLIRDIGLSGVFFLIFLESTLVPIPSLLVMPFAGYLAQQGAFPLYAALAVNSLAALAGSFTSYWLGASGGAPLIKQYGKYILVRPQDLAKTEVYFQRHGAWTVLIARFIPVVRHIISLVAGVARMPLRSFAVQTFVGSTIWGGGLIIAGYQLGQHWESVMKAAKRVDIFVAFTIVAVILGIAIRFYLQRRRETKRG